MESNVKTGFEAAQDGWKELEQQKRDPNSKPKPNALNMSHSRT